MFCTSCGFALEDSDRFCAQCGKGVGAGPTQTAYAGAPPRRLVRPMYDKSIAGVCSGFSRYLGVDVILMRIIWLCGALFTGGIGFIAYLVAWIIMPKDYGPAPAPAPKAEPSYAPMSDPEPTAR